MNGAAKITVDERAAVLAREKATVCEVMPRLRAKQIVRDNTLHFNVSCVRKPLLLRKISPFPYKRVAAGVAERIVFD